MTRRGMPLHIYSGGNRYADFDRHHGLKAANCPTEPDTLKRTLWRDELRRRERGNARVAGVCALQVPAEVDLDQLQPIAGEGEDLGVAEP